MGRKTDRTGEVGISNEGYVMRIVAYNNNKDVMIEFQDEHKYRVYTSYNRFKNGECKNPFFASVYRHGYLGVDKEGKCTKDKSVKRW